MRDQSRADAETSQQNCDCGWGSRGHSWGDMWPQAGASMHHTQEQPVGLGVGSENRAGKGQCNRSGR